MSTDRARQHSALNARDDLLEIVEAWPAMVARLGNTGSGGGDGMPKPPSKTIGLPINAQVSEAMGEITGWVVFLCRVLLDETDWVVPPGYETPALLSTIARTRLGHFTEHPDDGLRISFYDDAEAMAKLATRIAYPDGYRTLDTHIPCDSHDTSDLGERIVCAGTYTVRPVNPTDEPDLICSVDRQHRVGAAEWSAAGWQTQAVDVIAA